MQEILGNMNTIGQADSELLGFLKGFFFFSLVYVHVRTAQEWTAEFHAWATSQYFNKPVLRKKINDYNVSIAFCTASHLL